MERRELVWLVGMMGAGKSAVGAALARRLGTCFVDADEVVASAAGGSIPAIFEAEGEVGFRRRELEAIARASRGSGVVALGGGALTQPGVAARVKGQGVVVYLKASPRILAARVGAATERPLLRGLSEEARRRRIGELLCERKRAYEAADIVVETDTRSLPEVVEQIVMALAEAP